MKPIAQKYYGFALLFLACCFFIWKSAGFPIHDFANYYFGGKFLAEGHFNANIYFPYTFNKMIADNGTTGIFAAYAPNSPFLALVFWPFSFLNIAIAKLIFNGVSVVLLLFSLKRICDFYTIDSRFLWLLPLLFFIPLKNEILFGQVYFLLLFLLSESWLLYQKGCLKTSAFLLAFAILLKVFPVLLVLYFVFRKEFRFVLFVLMFGVSLFGITLPFSGFEVWHFFISVVLPKASNGEIAEAYVPNYQSLFMFFKQLMVYESVVNRNALFNASWLFAALLLAIKVKLIAIGFYVSRKCDPLLAFSYWILAMLLISPYGSTYTFVLLLFPFLTFVQRNVSNWKKISGLILIFGINNIPAAAFTSAVFPLNYVRLFLLILLFAVLFSMFYQSVHFKIAAIIAIVPFVMMVVFNKSEIKHSQYVLPNGSPVLVYDYKISKDHLTYFYWNESGANSASIGFDASQIQPAEIIQRQICYDGKQLTNDPSAKQKPTAVNRKYIVYLSDEDRGVGFFTLRKIAVE